MKTQTKSPASAAIVLLIPAIAIIIVFTAIVFVIKFILDTRKGQEVVAIVEAKRIKTARQVYTRIESITKAVNDYKRTTIKYISDRNLEAYTGISNTLDGIIIILNKLTTF